MFSKFISPYTSAETLAGFTQIFVCSDSCILQKQHLLSACTKLRSFIWIWRRKKFSYERFLFLTGLINWKMNVCQNWHSCTERGWRKCKTQIILNKSLLKICICFTESAFSLKVFSVEGIVIAFHFVLIPCWVIVL